MPFDAEHLARSFPFSIQSRGPTVGDDWPTWQRNLYPVTYWTEAAKVVRKLSEIEAELIGQRRSMHWHMKAGAPRVVKAYRREIDKLERWARNCRTQLLLIANSGPRLVSGRDLDAALRSMPTSALADMLGADEQRVA